MTIITIASNKGGTGKTTTAVSLAAGLANLHDTLLVDLDPQGQCALFLGLPVRSGLYEWLLTELPLSNCLLDGRPAGMKLLPGDSHSKVIERLTSDQAHFYGLVAKLRGLAAESGSPFVIFDTPPGGILQEAAIAAADHCIIPFECELASADGVYQTLELKRQLAPDAATTLLPVAFDVRLNEHREMLAMLVKEFGDEYGLDHDRGAYVVPARSAVKRATRAGETIWEHSAQGILDARRAYSLLIARVSAVAARESAAADQRSKRAAGGADSGSGDLLANLPEGVNHG